MSISKWLESQPTDWTPEEIAAASEAMKTAGQMSYEEFLAEVKRQDAERETEEDGTQD